MRASDWYFAIGTLFGVAVALFLFGHFVTGLWLDWIELKRHQERERDDGR